MSQLISNSSPLFLFSHNEDHSVKQSQLNTFQVLKNTTLNLLRTAHFVRFSVS